MAIRGQGHRAFKSPKSKWWLIALVLGALVASGSLATQSKDNNGNTATNNIGSHNKASDIKSSNPSTANNNSIGASVMNNKQYSTTKVQINGEDVPLPANGIIQRSYNQNGDHTSIDVRVNNSSNSETSTSGSSSVNVNINSTNTTQSE